MFIDIDFSTFDLTVHKKTIEFFTILQTSKTGVENRTILNSLSINKYFFEKEFLSEVKISEISAFFQIANGRGKTFRFKDEFDFKAENEDIVRNQLIKTYKIGGSILKKPICNPRKNTVKIEFFNSTLEEGKDYKVHYTTGEVVFFNFFDITKLKVDFEFDHKVRFENDELLIEKDVLGNVFFSNLILREVL